MKNKVYNFWDFDGTLIYSPLPETGKEQYKNVKGIEYPHLGWWGRKESLDLDIFDIKANDELKTILNKSFKNENNNNFILTARISKLKEEIKKVLTYNEIDVDLFNDFLYFNNRTKGERILDVISGYETTIKEINVYDDREKEFIVLEAVRPIIESYDITYNVIKIVS